jgi:hypothetical protein
MYSDTTTIAPLKRPSVLEYWDVTEVNAAVDATITLYWENATTSVINSCASGGNLVVAHYNGTDWESLGNGGGVTGTCAGGDAGTVAAGSTSFSPFTFGSTSGSLNPLPIELISFNALFNGTSVDVNWTTASEINNNYFTIERSIDGINFEVVKTNIPSKATNGYSSSILSYATQDLNNEPGIYYYRLKQTDFDGKFDYSAVQVVTITGSTNFLFNIAPNPNAGVQVSALITAAENDNVLIQVHDVLGQVLFTETIITTANGNNIYTLNFNQQLNAGVYFVTATNNGVTVTKRMVVQ